MLHYRQYILQGVYDGRKNQCDAFTGTKENQIPESSFRYYRSLKRRRNGRYAWTKSCPGIKTLVTVGKTKTNYVFVIPVAEELDLKKAAKCVGEKSIEMIKSKELLPLTGYVHGGCSPIGMKKSLKTVLHETARDFDSIIFSAGKIGYQVQMNAKDLEKVIRLSYSDLIVS